MTTKPTILIPGIQGTKLANVNSMDFNIKWSFFQKYFEDLNDLILKSEPDFDKERDMIIERNEPEQLAYSSIYNQIKNNSEVYIFGYDWRKPCEFNGIRLYAFVKYLEAKLNLEEKEPVDSFNFITHSLGGLVFLCFLKMLQKDSGNIALINKVTINVCPFLGSVSALRAIVTGEGGVKIPFLNSDDNFRKIARTFPSVYELLPVYRNSVKSVKGDELSLLDKNNWQTNVYDDIEPLFNARITMLGRFRSDNEPVMFQLNNLNDEERKKFLIIAGTNTTTQHDVVVDNVEEHFGVKNYVDFDAGLKDKEGDGIVGIESSTIYKESVMTLLVESKFLEFSFHALFLNDSRVQSIIKRFLYGTEEELASHDWWNVRNDSVRIAKSG